MTIHIKKFDINIYKKFNKDILYLSDSEIYNHWYTHGLHENRVWYKPNNYDLLSLKLYRFFNSDLKCLNDFELEKHYMLHGYEENRIFSVDSFLKNYNDFTNNIGINDDINENTILKYFNTNVLTNNILTNNVLTNNVLTNNVLTNNVLTNNVLTNNTLTNNTLTNNTLTNNVLTNNTLTNNTLTNNTLTNNVLINNVLINNTLTNNKFKTRIKTYYINLKNRADRNTEILNEINNAHITNYERYEAIVPTYNDIINCKFIDINKLWIKNGKCPDINNENDYKYITGAVGCKMSHYNILKQFYKNQESKYLLILEDDCVLPNNAIQNINNTLDEIEKNNILFNILYLSATIHSDQYTVCCDKITNNLLKLKTSCGNTTHGLIFSLETVLNVILILESSNDEIDNVYRHLVNNRYMIYPLIGYQRESISDIGLYREEEYNIKNGKVFYGKINEKYNFDDVQIKIQQYYIYKPKQLLLQSFSETSMKIYEYLTTVLNIVEVNNIDNINDNINNDANNTNNNSHNQNVTFIVFSYCYLPNNINVIYICDDCSNILMCEKNNKNINGTDNIKNIILTNIDEYNKLINSNLFQHNLSLKNNILYVTNNICSIYSALVTCMIININDYKINCMNNNDVYVLHLDYCVTRYKNFITNNKLLINDFTFIPAIKYEPPFVGCAISYKTIINNAKNNNLQYCKICEDDSIILNNNVILQGLNILNNKCLEWEMMSCFIVDVSVNTVIYDVIDIDKDYKLLKINKWTSTVYNIYNKSSYKYFENYDHTKANSYEKDETENFKWTIDRYLNFQHIWVIFPYPVDINNEFSTIWKSNNADIDGIDNYNSYINSKINSLNTLKNKLNKFYTK